MAAYPETPALDGVNEGSRNPASRDTTWRATVTLHPPWSLRPGSNRRHPVCNTGTLPTELLKVDTIFVLLVLVGNFEIPTLRLKDAHSASELHQVGSYLTTTSAPISPFVCRLEGVAVRAQHNEVLIPIIEGVAIDMICLQWDLPRKGVGLTPATLFAADLCSIQ